MHFLRFLARTVDRDRTLPDAGTMRTRIINLLLYERLAITLSCPSRPDIIIYGRRGDPAQTNLD